MSEKIEPALDAEEWAELGPTPTVMCNWGEHIAAFPGSGVEVDRAHGLDIDDDRHAIAAVALYGQPFGFTREDVRNIQWAAKVMERTYSEDKSIPILRSLADRIEALLPPEA